MSAIRCECGQITGQYCDWRGPLSDTVVVEHMPEYLRASHLAAGNAGGYPHNGAIRVRCALGCAQIVTHLWVDGEQTDDLDPWTAIVEVQREHECALRTLPALPATRSSGRTP